MATLMSRQRLVQRWIRGDKGKGPLSVSRRVAATELADDEGGEEG